MLKNNMNSYPDKIIQLISGGYSAQTSNEALIHKIKLPFWWHNST